MHQEDVRRQEEPESGSGSRWATARRRGGEFSWVLAGKVFLAVSNGVLILLASERLALPTYGLLMTVIGAQLLISRGLLMGTEVGVVRLSTHPDLQDRQRQLVEAGLAVTALTTLSLTLIVVLLEFAAARWIRWEWWVSASTVAGAAGTCWIDYAYFVRLGKKQYNSAAAVQSIGAAARLLLTGCVLWLAPDKTALVFLTYAGAGLIAGLCFVAPLVSWRPPDISLVKRLLRYSVWQGLTNGLIVLGVHQGTFLLMALGQQAASGIFGLAVALSTGVFILSNAYFEYLLPRAADVSSRAELRRFLTQSLAAAGGLVVLCVPAAVILAQCVLLVVTGERRSFPPAYYWLTAAMLLLVIEAPLAAATHTLSSPRLLTLELVTRVVLVAGIGFVLAPNYGIIGAAFAQAAGTAIGLLLLILFIALAWRDDSG